MAQTYTDNDVNRLIINQLTKTEYNGLPSISDEELYLVEEPLDNVPTLNSTNPVTSGGVYAALHDIVYSYTDSGTTLSGDASADTWDTVTVNVPVARADYAVVGFEVGGTAQFIASYTTATSANDTIDVNFNILIKGGETDVTFAPTIYLVKKEFVTTITNNN